MLLLYGFGGFFFRVRDALRNERLFFCMFAVMSPTILSQLMHLNALIYRIVVLRETSRFNVKRGESIANPCELSEEISEDLKSRNTT